MKLSVISPDCWPHGNGGDDYHMLLPSYAKNTERFFAQMQHRRKGGFTILDNGVAEGERRLFPDLLSIARQFMVNEVVLPDVLGDAEATKAEVWNAMQMVGREDPWGYMGVVQGRIYEECLDMVDFYLKLKQENPGLVRTIGIPRHLITTLEDPLDQTRELLARHIHNMDPFINIHLLGTNPAYIRELCHYGAAFRRYNVRGVDTSAPFVYAHHRRYVGEGVNCARPKDYFKLSGNDFDEELLEANVTAMKAWCHG